MILPKSVKVGPLDYIVTETATLGDLAGQVSPAECVIRLLDSQHPQQKRCTLMHELINAIADAYGLEVGERETIVWATAIMALLRDNPAMVDYVMGDCVKGRLESTLDADAPYGKRSFPHGLQKAMETVQEEMRQGLRNPALAQYDAVFLRGDSVHNSVVPPDGDAK